MEVAKRIRELREAKGLTQADMAKQLNIAILNYGKIERGITELTVTRLGQIAEILKIRVVDLFTDFDPDSKELIFSLQEELKKANKHWAYFLTKYNQNDDLANYCFELYGNWLVSGLGFPIYQIEKAFDEDIELVVERLQDTNSRKILFALLSFGVRSTYSGFFSKLIWKLAPFDKEETYLLKNFMKTHFSIENDDSIFEESDELVKAKIQMKMKGFDGVI